MSFDYDYEELTSSHTRYIVRVKNVNKVWGVSELWHIQFYINIYILIWGHCVRPTCEASKIHACGVYKNYELSIQFMGSINRIVGSLYKDPII